MFVLHNIPLCEANCQTGVGSAALVVLLHGAVGLTRCRILHCAPTSWLYDQTD